MKMSHNKHAKKYIENSDQLRAQISGQVASLVFKRNKSLNSSSHLLKPKSKNKSKDTKAAKVVAAVKNGNGSFYSYKLNNSFAKYMGNRPEQKSFILKQITNTTPHNNN